MGSSLHEDVDCLLKRTSHESPGVLPVDAVPGDGHQVTLGRHHVAQHGEVAVVDVQTVEGQDHVHLLLHTLPDSLYPEAGEDLADVVADGPHGVNVPLGQDLHQSRPVRLQEPLGLPLELPVLGDDDPPLVVGLGEMHVDLADGLQALQGHV